MAGIKISALPTTGSASANDEVPTNTLGAAPTVKRTLLQVVLAGLAVSGQAYGVGGPSNNVVQMYLQGTFTSGAVNAFGFYVGTTLVPAVDGAAHGVALSPTINKAASGTHSDFSSLLVDPPTIVAGAAGLTNAAAVKITGAPTVGTNVFALWVVSGQARFGGALEIFGSQPANLTSAGAIGFASDLVRHYAWGSSGVVGAHGFFTGPGGSGTNEQVRIIDTASANRFLKLTGSNGGNSIIDVSAGNLQITPSVIGLGSIACSASLSTPAGGSAGTGFVLGSSQFQILFGSGAPSANAAKGSFYLRSDGSATNNRAYINTDGAGTWTALTTAA